MPTKSKIFNILSNFYTNLKLSVVLPLVLFSMFMGTFGGSILSLVGINFKIFADNILSTGYGCGTYGQGEPKYGTACTSATSIIVPGSPISSSSNSIVLLSSSTVSSSSNLSVSSSSVNISSISSSQLSTISSLVLVSSSSTISSIANNSPSLSLKVNLSANYNNITHQMDNTIRSRNMIPIFQPYNQAPFNYSATEAYLSKTNIPTDAVDWVLIEIKDINKNSIFTKAAILKQNGDIVDVSGLQNITLNGFTPIQNYNYQLVVRHRNSIAIATNQNINFASNTNTFVDFTKNINVKASNQQSVDTNNLGQLIFGMRKANANGSDAIDAQDRNTLLNTQESDGIYNSFDINLDGTIDAQDRALMLAAQEASENI